MEATLLRNGTILALGRGGGIGEDHRPGPLYNGNGQVDLDFSAEVDSSGMGGGMFETSSAAMLLWNNQRHHLDANRAACDLLERSRQALLSLRLEDITCSALRSEIKEAARVLMAKGTQAGNHIFSSPAGLDIPVTYSATANIMPGVHIGIFVPFSQEKTSSEEAANLSQREKEVLTLLALGESNQTIASRLFLAPETVRNYTRSARIKLGAKSRSHAIAIAVSTGQIDLSGKLQP
jgi:DNA-binding CsgD family transcriptional regulator